MSAAVIREVDVAVVGAGTMGSMALWHLSRMRGADGRPLRVLGLEQFGTVHTHGAFSGESRLFRVAAKEGRLFVPAAREARSQWLELGRLAGRDLLLPSGVLHIAPGGHADLDATLAAIAEHDLPHRHLGAEDLRRQYPQFHVEDRDEGVLDELAGALRPESAVHAASRQAVASGAEILHGTAVLGIEERADGVRLSTSAGEVHAERVIVTAGPWTARLVPDLADLLTVRVLTLAWFVPEDIGPFLPHRFPGFMRDLEELHVFGAPSLDGYSIKASPHLLLPDVARPEEHPTELSREQLRWLGEQARRVIPALDPEPVRWSVHTDSQSPDGRPLIDTLGDGRITVAAGMSGNGFKFAPVWGQAAAELAVTGGSRWQHEEFTLAHHRSLLAPV